jgi:DNA invertase Pin-like site-specific DNA recombinase
MRSNLKLAVLVAKPKCYSYVRFSTPDQRKGDSLRRQLKLSEDYARERGLELDDTLHDYGLSAYHGIHKIKGALGRFLHRVETGEVPRGSTLIVESLDRLSREQVLDALQQFIALIKSGITIVTLGDNREYAETTINDNWTDLIISLTIMSRAHEESETKSKRIAAAWANKRERIADRKLTAKCPAWLVLNKDKTAFLKIEERCAVVKRIYELKLTGMGSESIAKKLNESAVWKPKNGWRKSYVEKILHTRTVIGEYQPYRRKVKGERLPVGEPIVNYFPSVVSPELFYAVQERLRQSSRKAGNGGGRNGKIHNLFGHLAKCGYCNSPMAFVGKGQPPKGGSYLVCDGARRGMGCEKHSVRYPEFESVILKYCKGLNPQDILPGADDRESELMALRRQLDAVKGEITQAEVKEENLITSLEEISIPAMRSRVEERFKTISAEKEDLKKQEQALLLNIEQCERADRDMQTSLTEMRELDDTLQALKGEERVAVRLRLRNELRQLIDHVDVYPWGRILLHPNRCEYIVHFKSGAYRILSKGGLVADHEKGVTYWFGNGSVDVTTDIEEPEDDKFKERISKILNKKVLNRL